MHSTVHVTVADHRVHICIIGASVSEPPLVDSTNALSRYIYI